MNVSSVALKVDSESGKKMIMMTHELKQAIHENLLAALETKSLDIEKIANKDKNLEYIFNVSLYQKSLVHALVDSFKAAIVVHHTDGEIGLEEGMKLIPDLIQVYVKEALAQYGYTKCANPTCSKCRSMESRQSATNRRSEEIIH